MRFVIESGGNQYGFMFLNNLACQWVYGRLSYLQYIQFLDKLTMEY